MNAAVPRTAPEARARDFPMLGPLGVGLVSGGVPRRQVAALLKRANIEFSQALQQTWDELDDPSIGGISFERCVRVSLLIFGNLMIV